MKYAQSKHFWTWFKRNEKKLQRMPNMDADEREYWLREIATHMRAYTKRLFFEVFFDRNRGSRFIITPYGNPKYFRMAETMARKAPPMDNWEIIALQPPGLLGELLEAGYGRTGIDLNNLWFTTPLERAANGRIMLKIYAELFREPTGEMEIALEAVIYEILGEKVIGLEIGDIELIALWELSEKQKESLVSIGELPAWVSGRDTSSVFINEKGLMEKRE